VVSYAYDTAGRLERVRHADGANQPLEDYRYAYTPDDQIAAITSLLPGTQAGAPKTADPANQANRIARVGNTTYNYDLQGQIVAKTNAQGTTQYQWDARGRLTGA
jgi:YD repeat-containing protein